MEDLPRTIGTGDRPGTLPEQVGEAFAEDGPLADSLTSFEKRDSQLNMAIAAAQVFESSGVLLAEAGTGTGKTLAYLVPAILSRRRVLVSTGTKQLQDQIYYTDLPILRKALDIDFTATYMKGRGNYLCLHRFDAHRTNDTLPIDSNDIYVETIAEWSKQTQTGDRAEIEDLPDDFPFWSEVAATSENCVGTECPQYQECFVTKMRQRAAEADLVVVNHHLLCADAAVRQSDYGEVIPACAYSVIDEAHQLEDVATQYFGISVSTYRLERLVKDGQRFIDRGVGNDSETTENLSKALGRVERCATQFFSTVHVSLPAADRTRLDTMALQPVVESGRHLASTLRALKATVTLLTDASEDVQSLGHRAGELGKEIDFVLTPNDENFVYFLERRGRGLFLRASPIDVSEIIRELLLKRMKATVLTSATLAVAGSFDYQRTRLGIGDALELRLSSEFDYAEQTVLYLPRRMPDPRTPQFTDTAAEHIGALLRATRGRAFVLFTSYVNLHEVHRLIEHTTPFPLLVQGTAPRTVLLRNFRNTPNAVLLATSSFWQGVDVAGDTLSCVIIDKLPFAAPGDPITAARIESIEKRGGNPFDEYQLPLAILTLLQGLGRLIRHQHDRGVLSILDPRVLTKGYGRRFLASLPPTPIVREIEQVQEFLFRKGV